MIYPTGVPTAKDYANGMAGILGHGDNELVEVEYIAQIVQRAMDQARAAGYAEAIEKAAKTIDAKARALRNEGASVTADVVLDVFEKVRALAPAATTEEPK